METKNMKILIFSLNGEHYATDICDVERILGYVHATEMPDAPNFIDGVLNYENNILPIINLEKKFNFPTDKGQAINEDETTKIIVIKKDEKKFGIIVDTVYEVSDVSSDLFEEAPPITTTVSRRYMKGLIKLDNRIVILLDMKEILSEDEEDLIF
ncbi:chemotaxis protein CheW [Clostridium vincentii]|uniref:Chemotaxis protein CheW n=1 Tax=Clostridium vincentii TaxID=52704 RepID=A0A2T0BFZ2_9CLOT|nr:chemotaxis protein CheW [Clostridium vincentii]PRR82821.1 Chemotaxis protein CheW [Clostridium vincentii]